MFEMNSEGVKLVALWRIDGDGAHQSYDYRFKIHVRYLQDELS